MKFSLMTSSLLFSTALTAQETNPIDWNKLVLCKGQFETLMEIYDATDSLEGDSQALGLKKSESSTPFIVEYSVDNPFTVKSYTTNVIVFADSAALTVLDESDTKGLAKKLAIPLVIDLPNKVMGKKVIHKTKPVTNELGIGWKETSLNISNVDSHPGQTLLGCNYKTHFDIH